MEFLIESTLNPTLNSYFIFFRGLLAVLYFPVVATVLSYLAIGEDFNGLPFGIFNEEVLDSNNCFNASGIAFPRDYECNLDVVSCRFISNINDTTFEKVRESCIYVLTIFLVVSGSSLD